MNTSINHRSVFWQMTLSYCYPTKTRFHQKMGQLGHLMLTPLQTCSNVFFATSGCKNCINAFPQHLAQYDRQTDKAKKITSPLSSCYKY